VGGFQEKIMLLKYPKDAIIKTFTLQFFNILEKAEKVNTNVGIGCFLGFHQEVFQNVCKSNFPKNDQQLGYLMNFIEICCRDFRKEDFDLLFENFPLTLHDYSVKLIFRLVQILHGSNIYISRKGAKSFFIQFVLHISYLMENSRSFVSILKI
jgi:hypothetical protein